MTVLERLAWFITARQYAAPIVGDTPRSQWLFAVRYGTVRKLANYYAVRRDYRHRRARVSSRPYSVRVDPATACNLRCPLCPTGAGQIDRRAFMSMETFDRILAEFGADAFIFHLWVWGEPLLHRDLFRMVAAASARGVGTEISTNLSLRLTDEQIDRLITAGLTWLIVSADGATPESYAHYRRGGNLALVLDNMRRFVARKKALGSRTPFVEWQFVPLRHNEQDIGEARRLAREIGVDGLRLKPARVDKIDSLTFAGQVPGQLSEQWMPADPRLGHTVGSGTGSYHSFHCPFLWTSVTIHPDGALAPCCETYSRQHDLGRFTDRPFDQAWNSGAYVASRNVALGRPAQGAESLACHGCKVFSKPDAGAQA
jgi:radical SAM protein with 4Fe4S-binding SPASM domain